MTGTTNGSQLGTVELCILLSILSVAVLFPIGFAVWALNSYSNYMDKSDKCSFIQERLSRMNPDDVGWNMSKVKDQTLVNNFWKYCGWQA